MVVFSECISHLHETWEYSHIFVLEYAEVPLYAPFEINGFVHSLTWKIPCFTHFGYLETVHMENLAILKMRKFPCFNFDTSSVKGVF